MEHLQADPGGCRYAVSPMNDAADPNQSLNILVVEDTFLIGVQLKKDIESLGHHVIGPAASVQKAHELIEREQVDAAVLDINLGHEDSYPIAGTLHGKDIPFLFITGYNELTISGSEFENRTLLRKPILISELEESLLSLATS